MKELNEYFQAQAALKEKQINEAKSYIPKILALCIKKKLHFDFTPNISLISVYSLENDFSITGYFSEELVTYQSNDEHCCTLKTIYEKLKTYKCK